MYFPCLCFPGNAPDHQWQSRHQGLCHGLGSSCGWPQPAVPGRPERQRDTGVNMLTAQIHFQNRSSEFLRMKETPNSWLPLAAGKWPSALKIAYLDRLPGTWFEVTNQIAAKISPHLCLSSVQSVLDIWPWTTCWANSKFPCCSLNESGVVLSSCPTA